MEDSNLLTNDVRLEVLMHRLYDLRIGASVCLFTLLLALPWRCHLKYISKGCCHGVGARRFQLG